MLRKTPLSELQTHELSLEFLRSLTVKDAIRKAAALIEALPYIRAFQGKVFVIKFGGAAMQDDAKLSCVLDDIIFLESVGIKPILVHGGGPAISRKMKEQSIEPKFIHGHRVTDAATLEIVREVLVDEINVGICRRLNEMDGRPCPITDPASGALQARRRIAKEHLPDGTVKSFDLGLVGDVEGINRDLFERVLTERRVPVVAPLACSAGGEVLNCNADMAAAAVAAGMGAEKAVFLSDTHGIQTDLDDPESLADTLTVAQVDDLIRHHIISGGMLPKVEACRRALEGGVRKTHIVDGRLEHSLLLEIFTDRGVGTQIIH